MARPSDRGPDDGLGARLLASAGSVIDRATLRIMGRAFQGRRQAGSPRRDPAALLEVAARFYGSPEVRARFFAAPARPIVRETARERLEAGAVVDLQFDSAFVPLFPDLADGYLAYRENRVVHARHFRHDRPRRTVVCVHGWGGGAFWIEARTFAARWLYRSGLDVVLAVLPLHGPRTPAQAAFSGALFPTANVFRTNEAFAQATGDVRGLLDWLLWRGAPEAGLVGMSLGGYVTALVASCEPRCAFAVPWIPAVSMADLLWSHGEGTPGRRRAERGGVTLEGLRRVFAIHAPLEHRPLVPHARRFILAGLGDRIAPPEQARALWEHWERPRIHWFQGAHLLQVGRRQALRELRDFLRQSG